MVDGKKTHFVEGFALSGDYVKELRDKSFTILEEPEYEESPDLDNPEKKKRKMTCLIELSDKTQIKWYPNKTSQKAIIAKVGYRLDKWIGFQGEFEVKAQKVGNADKQVLYVK